MAISRPLNPGKPNFWNEYVIEKRLGAGNFGEVFAGTRAGHQVAVKKYFAKTKEDAHEECLEVGLGLPDPFPPPLSTSP